MKHTFILLLAAFAATLQAAQPEEEMNRFIDRLMAQMTLEEKIGQLNLLPIGFDVTGPVLSEDVDGKVRRGQVGAVFNTYTPAAVKKLQDIAVKETRLGIPLIFGFDVIHGHRTIFPIPLGLSATWDLDLIERTARAATDEATAEGLNWVFSPMVDITRDPRWGRVSEGSGEDPWLGSRIAEAMVRGIQQDDLARPDTALACLKHFALYGASEAGRDYNTVDMSRPRMYNEYLPPYHAAVQAGVGSVMASFNEIDGIPATGNPWLLTTLLRRDWGFTGLTVSDYTGIMEMTHHGFGDPPTATAHALNAGCDMDMVSEYITTYTPRLIQENRVSTNTLDTACRRILQAKYRLGLFTDPYRYVDPRSATRILTPHNLTLAQEAAQKSIVLLKNTNNLLPLDPRAKIALIGPQIKRKADLIGNWWGAGDRKLPLSLFEAIQQKYPTNTYTYALGCNLIQDPHLIKKLNPHKAALTLNPTPPEDLILQALQTAAQADILLVALGEPFNMTGEAASLSEITLPEHQRRLLQALHTTGKPIILLLLSGRPNALQWEDRHLGAILHAWYPGTRGSEAIVETLFGHTPPTGKLTMTFPRATGQIPIYYNHKNTGRPFSEKQKYTTKYLDIPNDPLYPFGHGLTYTTFTHTPPRLSSSTLRPGQSITLATDLTNTGPRPGHETLQLYIRDLTGSATRPVKELKGFQRSTLLQPGQTQTLTFTITQDHLKYYTPDLRHIAEPGQFHLMIGPDSAHLQSATLTLLSE